MFYFISSKQYGQLRNKEKAFRASQGPFKEYLVHPLNVSPCDPYKTLVNLIFFVVRIRALACGAELKAAASSLLVYTLIHKRIKLLSKLICHRGIKLEG